jgi:hypothetical protein
MMHREARNEGQDPAQVAVAELVPERLAMSLMDARFPEPPRAGQYSAESRSGPRS